MMSHLKITIILLFSVSFLSAHESGAEKKSVYPFKERIHNMCAGHHHLRGDELKKICDQFSEHFDDILDLQATPPEFRPGRYINSLAALVKESDTLTKEQKQLFYRRSYEQVLRARNKEEEWNATAFFLVTTKGALSRDQLKNIAETTADEPLKKYIEETVLKKQFPLKKSGINRKKKSTMSSKKSDSESVSAESSPESVVEKTSNFPKIIVGVLLVGILGLLFKILKGSRH